MTRLLIPTCGAASPIPFLFHRDFHIGDELSNPIIDSRNFFCSFAILYFRDQFPESIISFKKRERAVFPSYYAFFFFRKMESHDFERKLLLIFYRSVMRFARNLKD